MTVMDLIKSSLRAINVLAIDDDVTSSEANEALVILNSMLDEWSNHQDMCFCLATRYAFNVSAGVGVYTVGIGGTWNTPRPVRIESLFIRDNTQTTPQDYILRKITNSQYQEISIKQTQSTFPYLYHYESSFPLGTLTMYPFPSKNMDAYLTSWISFTNYTALTEVVSLPPGYITALRYNLAVELASYHNPPKAVLARVEKRAAETLASVKRTNSGSEPVMASLDPALTGRITGYPNIYTG
jgi:hypothetical protein